jgi:hypothetical protein
MRVPFSKHLIAGVAVLLLVVLGPACSTGQSDSPVEISLASLALGPQQWQGKRIEVQGKLLPFTDPDGTSYGVIEDSFQNRVAIRTVEKWTDLTGQTVKASGVLEFDAAFGWYLVHPVIAPASG